MFNPALTTCASERMKTRRFSYFAGFAARERMGEAKPVKLKKVAERHFFDSLRPPYEAALVLYGNRVYQLRALSSIYSLEVALEPDSYLSPQVISIMYLPFAE